MYKKFTFILLFCALSFSGCDLSFNDVFKSSKDEHENVKVINVLDKQFYNDAHIPGSIQLSVVDVEQIAKKWKKNTTLVVYCSNYMCSASISVARKLKAMGFEKVFAYEAGMAGWKQAGLPVDGPAKESYLGLPNEKLSDKKYDVEEISTQDLKKLLESEGILKSQAAA